MHHVHQTANVVGHEIPSVVTLVIRTAKRSGIVDKRRYLRLQNSANDKGLYEEAHFHAVDVGCGRIGRG